MRRSLLTILIVACLACLIARAEQASGRAARHPQWVRTADGWENRVAVDARRESPLPAIHPGLVALFQLGVATFALVAFPSRARVLVPHAPETSAAVQLRRPKVAKRRLASVR